MTATRWILGSLALIVGALVAGTALIRSSDAAVAPSVGSLAPLLPATATDERTIAILRANLDQVRDATLVGDTLLLLYRHEVVVVLDGRVRHRFGQSASGAPDELGLTRALAAGRSGIHVLDSRRRELSTWTMNGQALARKPLYDGAYFAVPGDLALDRAGNPVATYYATPVGSPAHWVIQRWSDSVQRLRVDSTGAFRTPRVTSAASGLLIADALTHGFEWLDDDGNVIRAAARSDPPAWPVPDSVRLDYAAIMANVPAERRAELALPDFAPSLRDVRELSDGRLLVLTENPDEQVHVEILDASARPLARLTAEPLTDPVFLTNDGYLVVSEELDGITVRHIAIRTNGGAS